jgi:hypothetical protein
MAKESGEMALSAISVMALKALSKISACENNQQWRSGEKTKCSAASARQRASARAS